MQNKILKNVIRVGFGIYFFVLQILFGMSGGPGSLYIKLILLPLLFIVPFFLALDEKNEKRRTRFFIGSFVLPLVGALAMFGSDIAESIRKKADKREALNTYQSALATAEKDPAHAYLACYLAKLYATPNDEPIDCKETLNSVSDARFCRTLCPLNPASGSPNSQLCATHRSDLMRECADIMISKMDPKSPSDVCKLAGLINYQGPVGFAERLAGYDVAAPDLYFQGFYIWCLETVVRNEQTGEYKTLAELLNINLKTLPRNTRKPLPE